MVITEMSPKGLINLIFNLYQVEYYKMRGHVGDPAYMALLEKLIEQLEAYVGEDWFL